MMRVHLSNTQTSQDYYTQFAIIKKERKRKEFLFFGIILSDFRSFEKASHKLQ